MPASCPARELREPARTLSKGTNGLQPDPTEQLGPASRYGSVRYLPKGRCALDGPDAVGGRAAPPLRRACGLAHTPPAGPGGHGGRRGCGGCGHLHQPCDHRRRGSPACSRQRHGALGLARRSPGRAGRSPHHRHRPPRDVRRRTRSLEPPRRRLAIPAGAGGLPVPRTSPVTGGGPLPKHPGRRRARRSRPGRGRCRDRASARDRLAGPGGGGRGGRPPPTPPWPPSW
jgi:hypothetical protein